MTIFLVASGATLTIGIVLGYLIVPLRDAFKRGEQRVSVPILLRERRPGGREGRHTRSSHPRDCLCLSLTLHRSAGVPGASAPPRRS